MHRPRPLRLMQVLLFCAVGSFTTVAVQAQTEVAPSKSSCQQLSRLHLSQTSCDIAEKVCLGPQDSCLPHLLQELDGIENRCTTQRLDALVLRQDISEEILTASLEVDGFLAEIDSEAGHIREVRNRLSDKRDANLSLSTLGGAVGAAGGAAGSALQLGSAAAMTAGNWLSTVFGGTGGFFAFLGFFQQNGSRACFPDVTHECHKLPKVVKESAPPGESKAPVVCPETRDKKRCDSDDPPSGCSPTMLYALVYPPECNTKENLGFHSQYDPMVENYLDGKPPKRSSSRRELLIEAWGGNLNELRAGLSNNREPRRLTISELDERANKLADLRSTVSIMKRDLNRLARELALDMRCPEATAEIPSGGEAALPQ
jgi:hypothetical protein